ncbi:MAG: hypothetical protein WD059_01250 [Balneolaceae bacterium]
MDKFKLQEEVADKIRIYEGELLQLASMFLYNWTEGPWTPNPLTPEQIKELEKGIEEAESGLTYTMDEVYKIFEEKYGYAREKSVEYEAEQDEALRRELMKMLDYISLEHLIRLDIFLESHEKPSAWKELSKENQASIQRGKEDSKAGRVTDAAEFLKKHG